jgi:hypothetical protein
MLGMDRFQLSLHMHTTNGYGTSTLDVQLLTVTALLHPQFLTVHIALEMQMAVQHAYI